MDFLRDRENISVPVLFQPFLDLLIIINRSKYFLYNPSFKISEREAYKKYLDKLNI